MFFDEASQCLADSNNVFTIVGAIPVRSAPTTPPIAYVLPRLDWIELPAACDSPHTAPPINKLANDPARPAHDNQSRIFCQNAAPGSPSLDGDELTCANTRIATNDMKDSDRRQRLTLGALRGTPIGHSSTWRRIAAGLRAPRPQHETNAAEIGPTRSSSASRYELRGAAKRRRYLQAVAVMNQITVAGRIVEDPVRKEANDSVLCTFRVVSGRTGTKTGRLWIDVETWGPLAGTCYQHLNKGRAVLIGGRLVQQQWADASGAKRSRLIVRANVVDFLD